MTGVTAMPWKNTPPDLVQFIVGYLATLGAAGIGALAKVAEDVKAGKRKFWTKDLLLEGPAVAMMALVSMGMAEYLEMGQASAIGTTAVMGWLGPRAVSQIAERYRVRKED